MTFHKAIILVKLVWNKSYTIIELTFLKELILIKQIHQKSVIFITTSIFLNKRFKFNHMYVIDGMIY